MTIREIEALSGMTRANIRFYESEGLLTPNRMENGYRDYTRSDLDTLHKIRLLRALGLGIDEIRKLSAGETALGEALESRLSAMQTEQRTLVRAEEVARAMLRAHADYATLDTGRYLAALEAGAQTAVQQDVQPKLHVPWRRFFARMIDLLLYDLTWMVILTSAGLCAAGNRGVTLLNDFLALLTMLLLEPLLLHLFGTTPGKWLMGLRVMDESGKTLPLAAAWRRTWRVLWYGYGACIPIYSIIRTYSCWKAEQAEQLLEWEDGSELRAAPWKAWRGAAWAAAVLALLAATVLAGLKTCQTTYTGDLTVRQFADNYDYIHGTEGFLSRELYDDGTWAPTTQLGFQVVHHTKNIPNLSYTTKDGSLIGISLHMGAETCTGPVYNLPFRELYLTILAFDGARSSASADEALAAAARRLLDEPLQELHTQAAGYQIDYSLTTTGFTGLADDGSLELPRNTTGSYTLSYEIRKLDG